MEHLWNYVCAVLAGASIPVGIWWQIHVWGKCFGKRGSAVQVRGFLVTFRIPWRLWRTSIFVVPMVLGALVLSNEFFGHGIDDDQFWPLLVVGLVISTVFAVKVSCGALLIGVTGFLFFGALAFDSTPDFSSLFSSLLDVLIGGAPAWVVWAYTAACLGYALYSAMTTTIAKGVDQAIRAAWDLRG